jgi:hypothetical protein
MRGPAGRRRCKLAAHASLELTGGRLEPVKSTAAKDVPPSANVSDWALNSLVIHKVSHRNSSERAFAFLESGKRRSHHWVDNSVNRTGPPR